MSDYPMVGPNRRRSQVARFGGAVATAHREGLIERFLAIAKQRRARGARATVKATADEAQISHGIAVNLYRTLKDRGLWPN